MMGILLISSLIVIPNVTALLFGRGFKKTALISVSLSLFSVIIGLMVSYAFDLAPAGTIVAVSIALFLVALVVKYFVVSRQAEKAVGEIKS